MGPVEVAFAFAFDDTAGLDFFLMESDSAMRPLPRRAAFLLPLEPPQQSMFAVPFSSLCRLAVANARLSVSRKSRLGHVYPGLTRFRSLRLRLRYRVKTLHKTKAHGVGGSSKILVQYLTSIAYVIIVDYFRLCLVDIGT